MSDDGPSDDDGASGVNWLQDLLRGGLPRIILGKQFSKTLTRLISSATDVPVAALESVAQRIRDNTAGRGRVKLALATAAARAVRERPEIVDQAVRKWTDSEFRKQANREAVAAKALEDLADEPPLDDAVDAPSDDFMNLFEEAAERASSDGLRDILARILSGELRKPQSFSLQTLQFVSIVDQRLAGAMNRARGWITGDFIPIVGSLKVDEKLAVLDELSDAGLLRMGTFIRQFRCNSDGTVALIFPHRTVLLVATTATVQIPVAPLSRKGTEIMSLLSPADDEVVLQEIAEGLRQEVPSVSSVRIERRKVPRRRREGPSARRKRG
jgi:hypothetical protein